MCWEYLCASSVMQQLFRMLLCNACVGLGSVFNATYGSKKSSSKSKSSGGGKSAAFLHSRGVGVLVEFWSDLLQVCTRIAAGTSYPLLNFDLSRQCAIARGRKEIVIDSISQYTRVVKVVKIVMQRIEK